MDENTDAVASQEQITKIFGNESAQAQAQVHDDDGNSGASKGEI